MYVYIIGSDMDGVRGDGTSRRTTAASARREHGGPSARRDHDLPPPLMPMAQ
jgi:hypothetical protein